MFFQQRQENETETGREKITVCKDLLCSDPKQEVLLQVKSTAQVPKSSQ